MIKSTLTRYQGANRKLKLKPSTLLELPGGSCRRRHPWSLLPTLKIRVERSYAQEASLPPPTLSLINSPLPLFLPILATYSHHRLPNACNKNLHGYNFLCNNVVDDKLNCRIIGNKYKSRSIKNGYSQQVLRCGFCEKCMSFLR